MNERLEELREWAYIVFTNDGEIPPNTPSWVREVFFWYGFFSKGFLPRAGGLLQQPFFFLLAMSIISSVEAMVYSERLSESKAQIPSHLRHVDVEAARMRRLARQVPHLPPRGLSEQDIRRLTQAHTRTLRELGMPSALLNRYRGYDK